VVDAVDGHDADAIKQAIDAARADTLRPTLICCRTIIGYGAPNVQGTAATHGAALGASEIAAARKALGWEWPPFIVPDAVKAGWDARERGAGLEAEWQRRFDGYTRSFPDDAREFLRRSGGEAPSDWAAQAAAVVQAVASEGKSVATRKASERALEGFAPLLPELIGGSADLTGSNNTVHSASVPILPAKADGNYLYYGVREFGMAAIMNGLSLHAGFIPYGGTFLVFSDYARNALRMAALMKAQSILVLTHDSIGLGEDGPTHQPIEHLASLRAMPNFDVWRPCDGVETAVAWRAAIERREGPTGLILTRQTCAHVPRTGDQIDAIARGAYIVRSGADAPNLTLLSTGSEVALALGAADVLQQQGHSVRVVSMPCMEVFERQDEAYRQHVLADNGARLAIEAGVADCWWRYVAGRGDVVAMHSFGQSAPAKDLFAHYGFTVDAIVAAASRLLSVSDSTEFNQGGRYAD
jgi:transketolase